MKRLEKLGYMALGAFILALGITLGQFITPPIEAQSNGGITCKQLTFVDEIGRPLFTLQTEQTKDKNSSLYIRNNAGKKTMGLNTSILGNSVFVYDRDEKPGVLLHGIMGGIVYTKNDEGEFSTSMTHDEHGGSVTVYGKDGKKGVTMDFDELGGHVTVLKKDSGSEKAVQIRGFESGGHVGVYGKDGLGASLGSGAVLLFGTGGTAAMATNSNYANVVVKSKEGEKAAEMEVTEYGGRVDVF